jgi:hypothetical protein
VVWFGLVEAYAQYRHHLLDAFLVASLLRAARDGQDVVVHGPVSEAYNPRSYHADSGAAAPGRPHPRDATPTSRRAATRGRRSASAGIDSLNAYDHFAEVARFGLTHLVLSTGSLDISTTTAPDACSGLRRVRECARDRVDDPSTRT